MHLFKLMRYFTFFDMGLASSFSTIKSEILCSINSGIPACRVPITGKPIAIACLL